MIQDPGSGIDLSSVRMTIDTVRAAGWVDNSKWMVSFWSLASMLSNDIFRLEITCKIAAVIGYLHLFLLLSVSQLLSTPEPQLKLTLLWAILYSKLFCRLFERDQQVHMLDWIEWWFLIGHLTASCWILHNLQYYLDIHYIQITIARNVCESSVRIHNDGFTSNCISSNSGISKTHNSVSISDLLPDNQPTSRKVSQRTILSLFRPLSGLSTYEEFCLEIFRTWWSWSGWSPPP